MIRDPKSPVIVLGLGVTGLATARALEEGGVSVHGVSLSPEDPGRASNRCRVIDLQLQSNEETTLPRWVFEYARNIGGWPVVLPTSDSLALMLARHRDELKSVCRLWCNTFDQLEALISKDKLYRLASSVGIRVPPTLISPRTEELNQWCALNPGPYLVKPYYHVQGDNCKLKAKNKRFENADNLMDFVKATDDRANGLIIQRILRGGDAWMFDCYGLCDRNGHIMTMATHRRIRQYPPDFGITCYGEIPAEPRGVGERGLFELTEKFLLTCHYHGIFGIEWLQDRETSELYLLDFNARPFYTIGHLRDCGLNLPMLAYRELCGDHLPELSLTPNLRKLFWIDFWRDAGTFIRLWKARRMDWRDWIVSLFRCRSFAIWNIRDPKPAFWVTLRFIQMLVRKAIERGTKK